MNESFLIAITGNSGTGKSQLSENISNFLKIDVIKYECDRYHKWERSSKKWETHTHLNPSANYIQLMKEDIFQLKVGNPICRLDYNHSTGKFTDEELIQSKPIVLVSGLHTLYDSVINDFYDIKVYMDPQPSLRTLWKIKRDTRERSYSIEEVLQKINSRRHDEKYIECQKNNADIIIRYYTQEEFDFHLDSIPEICLELVCNNSSIFNATLETIKGIGLGTDFKYILNPFQINITKSPSLDQLKKIINSDLVNIDNLLEGYNGLLQIIFFNIFLPSL